MAGRCSAPSRRRGHVGRHHEALSAESPLGAFGAAVPGGRHRAGGPGYPMARQLIMSFQEFGLAQQFGQAPVWVGLDNYVSILTDSYFWTVLAKSLAFCAWTAGLTMLMAVGFALLMRSASGWSRTIMNISL